MLKILFGMYKKQCNSSAFTLLEIILTLVIVGLFAVMAVSFFSAGVTRSDQVISWAQQNVRIQQVLENMIQYYQNGDFFNGKSCDKLINMGKSGDAIHYIGNAGSDYNNAYGQYRVRAIAFKKPDGANGFVDETNPSATNYGKYLLVTISSTATSGDSLTYLFTASKNDGCNP